MPFSRGSSQPRDQTQVPHIVCGFFTAELPGKPNLVMLVVKNLPINAGDSRDTGSVPGWERSPGGGHDNPLQYSCLKNPMDRGAWRAMVRVKSQTRLKHLSIQSLSSPQVLRTRNQEPLCDFRQITSFPDLIFLVASF